jgi:hypothetical protein
MPLSSNVRPLMQAFAFVTILVLAAFVLLDGPLPCAATLVSYPDGATSYPAPQGNLAIELQATPHAGPTFVSIAGACTFGTYWHSFKLLS